MAQDGIKHRMLRIQPRIPRWCKGFTLIELLVIISIIGLLSSMLLASLRLGRIRSRDAKRKADMRQIQLGLGFYFDKFDNYPITDDGSGGGGGGGKGKKKGWAKNGKSKGTLAWQFSTDSSYWIGCNACYGEEDSDSLKEFLAGLPHDPLDDTPDPRIQGNYSYGYYSITGDDYELIAQLEEPEDILVCSKHCWRSHEQDAGKGWCPVCPNPNLNYSNFLYADH